MCVHVDTYQRRTIRGGGRSECGLGLLSLSLDVSVGVGVGVGVGVRFAWCPCGWGGERLTLDLAQAELGHG